MHTWNPFAYDDDCRVVLEEFYAHGTPQQFQLLERCFSDMNYDQYPTWSFVHFLLLATPAEKCGAVAKVVGWH